MYVVLWTTLATIIIMISTGPLAIAISIGPGLDNCYTFCVAGFSEILIVIDT